MVRTKLSPIEYTVLGIAWKRGRSSTYAFMKELSGSTSTYYRSKAGTIYPLVERMVKFGLMAQEEERGDRGEKMVTITPNGEQALRDWLSNPVDFAEVAHTVDLVRLRVFYLAAAKPEHRAKLIDGAVSALDKHVGLCEQAIVAYEMNGDAFSVLATRGVLFEAEARIAWLKSIRTEAVSLP